MTMQPWLKSHLIETGRISLDGVSRKAKLRNCLRCGVRTIIGLDHDPCGIPTAADPTHLDPIAELLAVALGRWTYDLTPAPALERRSHWNIRGPRHYPVLANHQCRDGVPLRIHESVQRVFAPAVHALPEEPPF